MTYAIKSHPTKYSGVNFRSRLEARWAAFFDLAGWKWEYEPIDLQGWTPDFRVSFPCGHSECSGCHVLLIEVKPYFSIAEFAGHPCLDYRYGAKMPDEMEMNKLYEPIATIPADASAAFGQSPSVVWWEMAHGAGGGVYDTLDGWVDGDIDELWKQAGNAVQWRCAK
jgi:hypothetical protein